MNIAIITAGGFGQRMGASIPKQFMEVNGKPIILYTLETFNNHPEIGGIVIACCNPFDSLKTMIMGLGELWQSYNGDTLRKHCLYNLFLK